MIAQVYPLRRMPRGFSVFDYAIPESLAVSVGDLVEIPFRSSRLQAIVRRIESESAIAKIKPISGILEKHYFNESDLLRIDTIAHNIYQSPSALLLSALTQVDPKPQQFPATPNKKSTGQRLNTEIAQRIQKLIPPLKQADSLSVQANHEDIIQILHWCIAQLPHQILILAPNQSLAQHLGMALNIPYLTTGNQTKKHRTTLFHAWRKGSLKVLIGNRQASLWPAQKLSLVIVLETGNADWNMQNRNPRFDVRRVAKLLAKDHGCSYMSLGAMQEITEFALGSAFHAKAPHEITFLSKKGEYRSTSKYLHDDLISAIELALQSQKNVLLFYNRKGIASHLECNACGKIPECGTCGGTPTVREDDLICGNCQTEMWIPAICPYCRSPRMKKKGIGNKMILKELQSLFPHYSSTLYEKGESLTDAQITVATDAYFSEHYDFNKKSFGLIVDLTVDYGLYSSDYKARETTAYKLHQLAMLASVAKAQLIVQTWMPEVLNQFIDAKRFFETELQERKKYALPPFTKRLLLNGKPTQILTDAQLKTLTDNDIIEVITATYE